MKLIEKQNKDIAEFMGWDSSKYYCAASHAANPNDWIDKGTKPSHCFSTCSCSWTEIPIFHYHNNWAWIMPVIEEIESIGYIIHTSSSVGWFTGKDSTGQFYGSRIIQTDSRVQLYYEIAVQFIDWYIDEFKAEMR